jgi:hypothetical protein
MWQADGIAGHLDWLPGAVPLANQNIGGRELVEELAFRPCCSRGFADVAPERDAGRLLPSAPGCLLRLGASRPPGSGAIRGRVPSWRARVATMWV